MVDLPNETDLGNLRAAVVNADALYIGGSPALSDATGDLTARARLSSLANNALRVADFGGGRVGLLAAWAAGASLPAYRIILEAGVDYTLEATDPILTSVGKSVFIDGSSSRIGRVGGGQIFNLMGEWKNQQAVTAIAADGTTVTVADGSGLRNGDLIKLLSDDPLVDYTLSGLMGEFATVYGVAGPVVTLAKPLYAPYRSAYVTNPRVARLNRGLSCTINLRALGLDDGASFGTSGILVQAFANASIKIDEVGSFAGTVIRPLSCYGSFFELGNLGRGPGGTTGYGVAFAGCEYSTARIRNAQGIRHASDSGSAAGTTGGIGESLYGAAAYNTTIDSLATGSYEAPFATHHGTRQHVFRGVRAIGCSGGISIRGVGNRAIGCDIEDCNGGLSAFTQYETGAITDDTTFEDCTVRGLRSSASIGNPSLISGNGRGGRIRVVSGYFEVPAGVSTSNLITSDGGSIVMQGNPFFDIKGALSVRAINAGDNCTGLEFWNAHFKLAQPASRFIQCNDASPTNTAGPPVIKWQNLVVENATPLTSLIDGPSAIPAGTALGDAKIGAFTNAWVGKTVAQVQAVQTGTIRNTATNIDFGPVVAASPTVFTPTIVAATPGDFSVSYTRQVGRQTKVNGFTIGQVTLQFTPTFTTASGALSIAGLPDATAVITGSVVVAPVGNLAGITRPSGSYAIVGQIASGAQVIALKGVKDAAAVGDVLVSGLVSGVEVRIALTYSYLAG